MDDALSIPPELDRSLAMAVLGALGPAPQDGDGTNGREALDPILRQVVHALQSRGAGRQEVLDALEDAFAALLAAHTDATRRATVRDLDGYARASVERLLAEAPV